MPTLTEAGVLDQESEFIQAVMAPAGAPKEVVDKLYREIALIIMLLEVKARLAAIGYTAVGNTPEECSAQTKEGCRALGKGHPRAGIKQIE